MATISQADFTPTLDLSSRRIAVDPVTRRIAVRIASWNDVHSGFSAPVRMPKNVNVDAAHVGQAMLDDGSTISVATLPMNTMHAPRNLDAMHAASWYENTGDGVARVRYSTDSEGLRADGVLFDSVDQDQMDRLTAAAPSGDWRSAIAVRKPTDFEHTPADLVGACIVNIPGFSDTYSQSAGQRFALAASAHSIITFEEGTMDIEVNVDVEPVLTAAADAPSDGTKCDKPCEGCTCERKDASYGMTASADETKEELESLKASALAEVERVDVLLAAHTSDYGAGATDGSSPDAMDAHEARMARMEQRISDLEQLVVDALLSM